MGLKKKQAHVRSTCFKFVDANPTSSTETLKKNARYVRSVKREEAGPWLDFVFTHASDILYPGEAQEYHTEVCFEGHDDEDVHFFRRGEHPKLFFVSKPIAFFFSTQIAKTGTKIALVIFACGAK